MKSFNQYLTEAQSQHSVFDSIVKNILEPPVFFTPTVMRRLDYEKKGFHSFHATDEAGIIGLAKIQGSKSKQISTMSPNSNASGLFKGLFGGIETKGGILAVLEGSVSVRMNMDIFTGLTVGGRRTVLIGYSSPFGNQIYENLPDAAPLIGKLNNALRDIIFKSAKKVLAPAFKEFAKHHEGNKNFHAQLQEIVRKLSLGDTDHKMYSGGGGYSGEEDIAHLIRMAKARKNKPENKVLTAAAGRFVKEYMDGMEKVLSSNRYTPLFVSDPTTEDVANYYDEYVLHDFRIKKVFVYAPNISMFPPPTDPVMKDMNDKMVADFENSLKKAGIDMKNVEYVTDADYRMVIKQEQERLKSLNDKLKDGK